MYYGMRQAKSTLIEGLLAAAEEKIDAEEERASRPVALEEAEAEATGGGLDGGGLDGGSAAGIAVGVAVFLALVGVGLFVRTRDQNTRVKRSLANSSSSSKAWPSVASAATRCPTCHAKSLYCMCTAHRDGGRGARTVTNDTYVGPGDVAVSEPSDVMFVIPDEDGGVVCAQSSRPVTPPAPLLFAVPGASGSIVVVEQQLPTEQGGGAVGDDEYLFILGDGSVQQRSDVVYAVPDEDDGVVCARSSRPVEETSEPPALPSKKKGQHIPPQQQVHAVPDEDGGVVCARSSHPIEQTSEPPALPSKKGQQVPPQQQEVCAVPDTGGSEVVVKQQQPAQQGAAYDGYMSVREETQDVTYAVPGASYSPLSLLSLSLSLSLSRARAPLRFARPAVHRAHCQR